VERAKVAEWVRRIGLPLVLLGATIGFGILANHHYPIKDWLFLRYATFWLLSALFAAACFSSGHALVTRILGGSALPILEHVTLSFAAGLYVFFLATLVGGLLGLYGRVFFFALPLLVLATGARPTFRYTRRAVRHLRGAWRRSPRPSLWELLAHAVGFVGLGAVYFATLTPNNAAFDSRWYHLGIAEHYTAMGAVRRFPEGWILGTWPHLASLLYTWAFQMPGGRIADHIELAAHVEMTIFAISLVGIAALVRRLLRPGPARGAYRWAWAVRFFFPGVFVYDSSVCLGADHVAAAFAAPIYLAFLRAWKDLSPRACTLLSLALTGAILAKYTSAMLLAAPVLFAIAFRVLVLGVRVLRRRMKGGFGGPMPPIEKERFGGPMPPIENDFVPRHVALGPLCALGAGLAFTAPQWLKNLVWYGDPAYPVFHKLFRPRPWTADAALRYDVGFTTHNLWAAERSWKGLGYTLGTLATFSFVPNDWGRFHGATPVFGSLFTLAIAAMLFLRGTKRLWGLYLITHMGILVWYWTNHQDRYLQAALPWMTAATAAVLGLVWQRGRVARVCGGALVALQLVWGADVYFMPAHVFLGVPAKAVIDLLSRTPDKATGDRLVYSDGFVGIGKVLPPKATALIHEYHPHLGIGVPSVSDCPYHQGGISYALMPTPREVYETLTRFGVTHLVYQASTAREPDALAGEIVFFNFVQRAAPPTSAEGWFVAAMPPAAPPPGGAPDPVLMVTCNKGLPAGLYHLADLDIPSLDTTKPAPKPFNDANEPLAATVPRAMAIAQDQNCAALPPGVDRAFVKSGARDPYNIWVRR
jgi:hypothetical protein